MTGAIRIRDRLDAAGTVAMLSATLCWAGGPLFIRYLSGYMDLWSQNFWRYAVAMVFWLPWLILWQRQGKVTGRVLRRAVVPGLVNIVMQSFWAWSFYLVLPGFGTFLSRSSLVWTAAFCIVYFPAERPLARSLHFWSGAILTVAGVAFIIGARRNAGSAVTIAAVAVPLFTAVLWSLYTITARIAFEGIDSRIGFSVVSVYTAVGLGLAALLLGAPGRLIQLGPEPLAAVGFSGITSIAIAHALYYTAIKRIGASIPAMILQASPFMTLVLSMAIFGERLTALQWTGGVVLILGSCLSVISQEDLAKAASDQ